MTASVGSRHLGTPFVTRVLRSLVRTRSVNEPGSTEAAMARRVARWLAPTGAEVELVESLPGRPSVGARLRGAGDGPSLVLNGHIDTIGLDDASLWTKEPFAGEVEDGFLYGRGACDMKAGIAAQIAVARHLAPHVARMNGTLVLQFAMGEERSEPGTRSLVEAGYVGDCGIVTEPTELRVAVAQRGATWYEIRVAGRSIHASQGHLGLNPIHDVPRVLETVDRYAAAVRAKRHPFLPGGSCHATLVQAGIRDTAIPDSCSVTVDRRLLPGETAEGERAVLERALREAFGADAGRVSVALVRQPYEPAEIPADSAFAGLVLDTAVAQGRSAPELWGTPFSSDIGVLVNDAGIETVTFGPGNVAEAHCADERVELDQVSGAAQVIAGVAETLFGLAPADGRGEEVAR